MADIIQLLPDSIANQIAAGEVVQRPASAVKELMENSIDAGASSITVIVKEAGKSLIQVIDDGMGMSETDARMSLERHATSKIRKADDLFALRTMGFRGEALASIAAISQLEMRTRRAEDELGTELVVEGSEVKRQTLTACEKGTSVSVKNLFYNVPARRNFLKSNQREMAHIVAEFQRLALAHPQVHFMLVHGDEVLYEVRASKLSQRIVNLLGKPYQQHLAPVEAETSLAKISGYVGRPQFGRKSRAEQFLFVNQRFIKSNNLAYAVTQTYEGMMPPGQFPFFCLFIEVNPAHIDVNVHPTKTEIKFADERAVFSLVSAAVKQGLGLHNLVPAIDFQADVNLMEKLAHNTLSAQQYFDERFTTLRTPARGWEKMFEAPVVAAATGQPATPAADTLPLGMPAVISRYEKVIFQLFKRYVVRPMRDGLLFIDQQAAHECVLFEKFMLCLKGSPGASQQSLFPHAVHFSPADFALVMEMQPEIYTLGFRFEIFGKTDLLITGLPAGHASREKEIFEGLIEQFKQQQALALPLPHSLSLALAKRAAIKAGQELQREEMEALVESLFACRNPNYSPEGRPTFFRLDASMVEEFMK